MQKSGFFNALRSGDDWDRKYNANDYSDNLAVVISNGVLRSNDDDLRVTASGMVSTVGKGRAWIDGHYYYNDSSYSFPAVTAPVGGNRYDRIMLRLDTSLANRSITLVYVTGTVSATPVKPSPTRSGDIYDLVLADIYVATGATSVVVTDTRSDSSICGWVYSTSGDYSFFTALDNAFWTWFSARRDTLASVTLFKRYNWRTVIASATSSVVFNIPQYDANTCFLEVFVNGMVETLTTDYTVSGSILTFTGTLTAGTEVEVKAYKSIDGTGIQTISGEITQLQNQVAALDGVSKWTFKCSGLNDNIALSQIANALYTGSYTVGSLSTAAEAFLTAIGGNNYLASLPADFQAQIDVVGTLGVTTPYSGSGTSASRYRWFSLGSASNTEKKVVFDFGKCSKINVACSASTENIVFYGTDIYIRNANVYAGTSASSCAVTMFVGGNDRGTVDCENCRLKIVTTGKAVIASNGTFRNCVLHVKSTAENAFCIDASDDGLVRMVGCTCYAYTGTTAKMSATLNIESGKANAIIMVQNANAPTVSQTGYYQNYFIRAYAGMVRVDGVCTTLSNGGNAVNRSVSGLISISKR